MRGATLPARERIICGNISIHAPHAGRDILFGQHFGPINISIHATQAAAPVDVENLISIHAPHAGRDALNAPFFLYFL